MNPLFLASAASAGATDKLVQAIQGVDLSGVLNGVLAVVPVVLPVTISLIAVRKGIAFLRQSVSGC